MACLKPYLMLVLVCALVVGCARVPVSGDVIEPSSASRVQLLRTLGRGEITQLAMSPDSSTLAVASSLGVWLYESAPLLTTERIEQQPAPRLLAGHLGDVTSLAFSADGARLASGGEDRTVWVWDVATGSPIGAPLRHEGIVTGVSFSPNGAVLASSSDDNRVYLWDFSQAALDRGTFGSPIGTPLRQNNPMTSIAFSPMMVDDTMLLAAGSTDPVIRIWTLDNTGQIMTDTPRLLRGFTGSVLSLAFSLDGQTLASGHQDFNGVDNRIHLWDMTTYQETAVLSVHTDGINSLAFSPNGRMLVSASSDRTARLWNLTSRSVILTMDKHAAAVSGVVFARDNNYILSGGNDGKVRIWNVELGGQLNQLSGYGSAIISVAFSPDGLLVAAGTDDNAVHLWDTQTGDEVVTLRGHTAAILTVAFSPDGTRLASGSRDRTILLWDVEAALSMTDETGELYPCDRTPGYRGLTIEAQAAHACHRVVELREMSSDVRSVAFSTDGWLLVSGGCASYEGFVCQTGEIRLWDVNMPGELARMFQHSDWVESVAFSPDGAQVASSSRDQTIAIWDVEDGQLVTTLSGHEGWVESVAFSDDGFLLASGGGDEKVFIWDLDDPNVGGRPLVGHTEDITDVVFDPDGRLIVSTSLDDHVRVWDMRSGVLLSDLIGHIGDVNSVSFRQDGVIFATGGADGTIRLWGLP